MANLVAAMASMLEFTLEAGPPLLAACADLPPLLHRWKPLAHITVTCKSRLWDCKSRTTCRSGSHLSYPAQLSLLWWSP